MVAIAVVGISLASGPFPPFDGIYGWLYENVPLVESLRVPNRWLMVSSIGTSFLAAGTMTWLGHRIWRSVDSISSSGVPHRLGLSFFLVHLEQLSPRVATSIITIVITAVPVLYIYQHGYLGWSPPEQEIEVHEAIRAQGDDGRVLTIPYWQQWMHTGSLAGFSSSWVEHDIGTDSSAYHGRPVVGPSSNFYADAYVDYLREIMLENGTTNFAKLLVPANVEYVVEQGYNPTSSLPAGRSPDWERRFLELQRDLKPVLGNNSATVYNNEARASNMYSVERAWAVVGGYSALGSAIELPKYDLRTDAPILLSQVARVGGRDAVEDVITKSGNIMFIDSDVTDLAMLLVEGIEVNLRQRNPSVDTPAIGKGWVLSDSPRRKGMMVNNDFTLSAIGEAIDTFEVSISEEGQFDIWVRLLFAPNRSHFDLSVDGTKVVGAQPTIVNSDWATLRWVKLGRVTATSGIHTVELASSGDGRMDVDQVLLTPVGAFEVAKFRSERLVEASSVVWLFEAERIPRTEGDPIASQSVQGASWGKSLSITRDGVLTARLRNQA